MIDYGAGAFDQGFRQQGEHNRARRLQNRQAIQQYMNQAAQEGRQVTPDEIAKFSEEISGGSNWLDAAFPTKNFSQSMIEAQNRRAQQTMMEQNAKALQTQELEQKSIGSLILAELQAGTSEDKIGEKLIEKGVSQETLARHDVGGLTNRVKQASVNEVLQSPQFKLIQTEDQLDQFLQTQAKGMRDIAKPFGLDMIRQRQAQEGNVVLQRVAALEGDGSALIGLNDQQLLSRAENLVHTTTGRADQTHIATVIDHMRTLRNNAAKVQAQRNAQLAGQRNDRRTELLLKFADNPTIQAMMANGDESGATRFISTLAPEIGDAHVFVSQLRPVVAQQHYAAAMQKSLKQATDEVRASRGRVNTSISASLQAASNDQTKNVMEAVNRVVTGSPDLYIPAGREDEFALRVAELAKQSNEPNSILNAALADVGGLRMPEESMIQKRANEIQVQRYPVAPGTRFDEWQSHARDLLDRIVEAAKTNPQKAARAAAEQRRSLQAVERQPFFFDNPAVAQAGIQQLRAELEQAIASLPTQKATPSTVSDSRPQGVQFVPGGPVMPMEQAQAILESLRNEAARLPQGSPEQARALEGMRLFESRIRLAQ